MSLAPVPAIIDEIRAGRMVILVDDEDRENEGDLIFAAEFVTPEKINFMAKHARGLICLTLDEARVRQLNLPPMVRDNRSPLGTAFTVSIEAATGVTTGISAKDRARTVQAAVAPDARPESIVQPGHIFPLMAQPGGVLVRAGHTEAGCDLTQLAGLTPAAVICEILKDDGTMARLPDLVEFGRTHGIKLGTIADLIHFRSQHESLVKRVTERTIETAHGPFRLIAFVEKLSSAAHLALVRGEIDPKGETLVRVHEPLSLLDLLDAGTGTHSWSLNEALARIAAEGCGVLVLLNCSESAGQLIARVSEAAKPSTPSRTSLLTYGIGAQILRELKVGRMRVLAAPRKMPSMAGWELEIAGYESPVRSGAQ
ncbi:MAG TPA: bifunctional 3,4-dihydroxy-2-butanone-4-phosphate synthase/GTP cyclohydrolase II [Burkholderiales bacterium]|nr:bifunctional 3,4-dihydroxy-2-butanone-4-phosphate synthase/GTP cyclohydrolase II [Burkholderiales bacterium]